MFRLFACMFLLVGEMLAKGMETMSPAIQEEMKVFPHLVKQNTWEENVNLTSLSCTEMNNQTWTSLDLKKRGLTSFPACLPDHLEHLDLSANLLSALHSQHIARLPKLQVLSLEQNAIQQVTWDSRSPVSRLQFLDLSFNLLPSVPACNASTLGDLQWLSLAGNPITEIPSLAFSCYPRLRFLNLSSTWLGKDGKGGIGPSAFAANLLHVGDFTEHSGSAIGVLDLSATFLERIGQEWTKDLSRLKSFHLLKMTRLRSLEAAAFLHMPMLAELDCRDSQALTLVETGSFNHKPHLALLLFQNCNLSSFSPWDLSSSGRLLINLYGNPLVCHCGISWLLSNPDKIVLQRASETTCQTAADNKEDSPSGSRLLPNMYDECEAQKPVHLTPLFTQGKLLDTFTSVFTKALPSSPSGLSSEELGSSLAPQNVPLTWGDVTPLAWEYATEEDLTKADLLAYKELTMYTFTDNPPPLADVSTTWDTLPVEPILTDTTEMEQDASLNSVVPLERAWGDSTVQSPISEPASTDASQLPDTVFAPYSTARSDQTMTPSQGPTKSIYTTNLTTTDGGHYYTDDYDGERDRKEPVTEMLEPCDYDPCRHLQKPCADLQTLTPCLCPGLSDEFTIPGPPRLQEVSEIRDTSAEIQWCAPYSEVGFYQLAYRPQGSKNYSVSGEIYMTARRHTLYNLLPSSTYEVCVIASNKAGQSQTSAGNKHGAPCGSFATSTSYKSIFAALGATTGLFFTTTVLLSVCLCRKCRAPHIEHYNTHLVSYKNPAFDYSSK